ncbi:hypothetical protein M0D21_12430 [Aquimarina sp. D1M17]|uniref:hypothetical protein n=1 Tax=Aquimarina acroporae TaxID=2937283 RepID=UPI0020BECA58|nr:hypothetical protein [Aquimarina acroporae]MCK8522382.1 hypothetical protein [Aquimarina acroporae]
MKFTFSILFTLLFLTYNHAQSEKNVFFDQSSLIKKFHTIDELEELKKGDLIKLYTERVHEVITILPYLALTNEADVTLSDIGIKESSDNLKALDKHHDSTEKALENTSDLIIEFIPYADTEKIIWSILYFEEVIKKIRIGTSGNF